MFDSSDFASDRILNKEYAQDWQVVFEEGLRSTGFTHLKNELPEEQARSLFAEAEKNKIAYFKDEQGKSYCLFHLRSEDLFLLLQGEDDFKLQREYAHSWRVYLESGLYSSGLSYLASDLEEEEAGTIFEAAKEKGWAHFEDDSDRDYTLFYNRSDDDFVLQQRIKE